MKFRIESLIQNLTYRCLLGEESVLIENDCLNFESTYPFFKNIKHRDLSSTVLVASLSDWVAQIKIELLLAKSLERQGAEIVILTYSHFKNALKYFKIFGFQQFIFLDDYLPRVPHKVIFELLDKLFKKVTTFSSAVDLVESDCHFGRYALSTMIRELKASNLDFEDAYVRELLKLQLENAIRNSFAAELIYEQVRPEYALFFEKGYTPYAQVFDVMVNRGIGVIQWAHSHRRDALVLKRYMRTNRHVHPFSLSDQSWQMVQKQFWSLDLEDRFMKEIEQAYREGSWFNRKFLHEGKRIKTKEAVEKQLGLDAQKRTAVIFSHVLWDATFFFGKNLFRDYEHWLIETVRVAIRKKELNWIIKLHPDYVWKAKRQGDLAKPRDLVVLRREFGDLPDHIKIVEPETDISTYSFFQIADYCLTVRGTVGIEMACFGVPVITAGTGRYSGCGFTIDSENAQDYLTRLERIEQMDRMTIEQVTLARKFAYFLFNHRPCPFQSFEMIQEPLEKLGNRLDHNVNVRLHSVEDFLNAEDLQRFSDWALNSRQEDFLMTEQPATEVKKNSTR